MINTSQRLESLDVLRGFDLFCLTILCPFIFAFNSTGEYTWMSPILKQFSHVDWVGFAAWDLVMPLFMFMTGVSMPFALSKYIGGDKSKGDLYKRVLRRFVLLWILGMVCQGNLLSLKIENLKLFTNTLQAIAIGYLFSTFIFLHTKLKGQLIITVSLLLTYWFLLTFVSVNGYGNGNFSPQLNLAEWGDRVVLGKWRDTAYVDDVGNTVFPPWYNYTWILSSLNFIVTVMSGVFAGQILKNKSIIALNKVKYLLYIGVALVAVGWLWHLQMPVIKKIWTSSMTLVSSGYCFLLMAAFYYIIDYKGYKRGWTWLKVIGMNSILAYILSVEVGIVNFSSVSKSVFFGMEQYLGNFYPLLIVLANMSIIYAMLYAMYKCKVFVRI